MVIISSYIMNYNEETRGWIYTLAIYTYCYVLHRIVPHCDFKSIPTWTSVPGYACNNKTGKPLKYRYNAFIVLLIVIATLYYGNQTLHFNLTDLTVCFFPMCRCAFVTGLAISTYLSFRGKSKCDQGLVDKGSSCLTTNGPRSKQAKSTIEFENRTVAEHFYCGIEWNPEVLGIDLKMFNYLIGAIVLACNIMAAVFTHLENVPNCSYAMYAYLIPMSWFIGEYMWFENVHVYTYDIFRERTGFKMCWGCWCFYPFFYCIGIWPIVNHFQQPTAQDISQQTASMCIALFYLGWVLTRGANLQKFSLRHQKQTTFLFVNNDTIPGSNNKLLCSGWWGLARHINYLGEILQGLALALPGYFVSGSLLPFLYPFYYVLLFVGRDIDDDKACLEKYGKAWEDYLKRVPYRIVPGIY